MEFKDKLTIQRKQNNYSQEQLADLVGVSRQSVSKWETGESYPDMAKIIQLCKILNCELTDLLDDGVLSDVKSVSAEQPKSRQLIDYFNGFLDFVTKVYNMFIHMTFKSKLTMIIELMFLALFLTLVGGVVVIGITELIRPLISILPDNVYWITFIIISNVVIAIIAGVGIVVFIHLFKIRYLDYYVTVTDNKVSVQSVEEPIEDNRNSSELVSSVSPRIVIRDPKHSSSRFIEMLVKIVIVLFKLLVVVCVLPVLCAFVMSIIGTVVALANVSSDNGIIFFYISLNFAGCVAICYVIVHFAYNVVSGQKQPLKMFLITMLAGLLVIGIGSGLTINRLSTFSSEPVAYKSEIAELEEIEEGSGISFWTDDVEYIFDEDVTGVRVEALIPENYRLITHIQEEEIYGDDEADFRTIYSFFANSYYEGPFEALGSVISHLKQGSLVDFEYSGNRGSVKVYLPKQQYEKLTVIQ